MNLNKKHKIEIPEEYLLFIAVHGNLGSGELGNFIKTWARKECFRLGLKEEFELKQTIHLQEMGQRIRNVIGDQAMDNLQHDITVAGKVLMAMLGSKDDN